MDKEKSRNYFWSEEANTPKYKIIELGHKKFWLYLRIAK